MIVAELVAKLQMMPQDHVVLCYDDRYGWIDPEPSLDALYQVRASDNEHGDFLYLQRAPEGRSMTPVVVL